MTARAIELLAPAKINWTLLILGRRPDGFHEVDTVMQAISLFDTLRFTAAGENCDIKIHGDGGLVPADQRNLIWRAWSLMRERFPGRVLGLRARVWKRIPSGAGLGGGSSDAAATLVAVNRLYGLRQSRAQLAAIGAELGSDIPFFLFGGAARATGRGEAIAPIASRLRGAWLAVVYPGFPSPTAKAYSRLKPADYFYDKDGRRSASHAATRALEQGTPGDLRDAILNSFETSLLRADRRYARLAEAMKAVGLGRPTISGSGSAMFGWAGGRQAARAAAEALAAGGMQAFAVEPTRSGIRVGRPKTAD